MSNKTLADKLEDECGYGRDALTGCGNRTGNCILCAAAARLRDADGRRHDCEAWAMEGIACSRCNPMDVPCPWCEKGDTPIRVDKDGVTSDDGQLVHTSGDTWWPCLGSPDTEREPDGWVLLGRSGEPIWSTACRKNPGGSERRRAKIWLSPPVLAETSEETGSMRLETVKDLEQFDDLIESLDSLASPSATLSDEEHNEAFRLYGELQRQADPNALAKVIETFISRRRTVASPDTEG